MILHLPGCIAQHSNMSAYKCMSGCRSRGREFDLAQSHTFVEIDHEIISTVILLSSNVSRRVVVSYKQKYVHKVHVLVNRLVKLAQEKVWLSELTVPTRCKATNQTKNMINEPVHEISNNVVCATSKG